MAGRPAGLSDDESQEDDFFEEAFQDSTLGPIQRKRQPTPTKKQPVSRSQIELDEFRISAVRGNVDKISSFLSRGVPVDQILRSGWTALMYAASSGQWKAVEYLLENKADPNFHKELFTPLMATCASSHDNEENLVKCVELLMAKGVNINAAERHKVTPLMFACKERRLKIVKLLLDNEVDVNFQDNHGWTALMWAADKGDGLIIRELLERGKNIDPNILSSRGQKAIDIALAGDHKEAVALLDSSLKNQASEQKLSNSFPAQLTELETVLMGLDLNSLIPIFHEHRMDYHAFLLLDEEDLDRLNITEVGYRTRLLSAIKEIHLKEWSRGSLPAIQYSKYLNCPEATSLMANLALHGRYMEASVAYLRDQIQKKPRILQLGMETASVHALAAQTRFALKHVQGLQEQLKYLHNYLEKIQDKEEFVPADLIIEKNFYLGPSDKMSWKRYLAILFVAAIGGMALWRGPSFFHRPSTVLLVSY